MQTDTFVAGAASASALAAAAALVYSRASARAARDAVAAAERTVKLAEMSRQAARQAADRARLRRRLERVGELVQQVVAVSASEISGNELSEAARMRCGALGRALIGLVDFLPRSAELSQAQTSGELTERAASASLEVDQALRKLVRYRRQSTYRPRHATPWHRPDRARSAALTGDVGRNRIRRPPSP